MKRLWIAGTVLLALAVWCAVSATLISHDATAVIGELRAVSAAADREDYDAASRAAARAERRWTDREDLLGALLRHDEADQVMNALAQLRQYAAVGDRDDLLAICATAIRQLEHIREMELPLLRNVL